MNHFFASDWATTNPDSPHHNPVQFDLRDSADDDFADIDFEHTNSSVDEIIPFAILSGFDGTVVEYLDYIDCTQNATCWDELLRKCFESVLFLLGMWLNPSAQL